MTIDQLADAVSSMATQTNEAFQVIKERINNLEYEFGKNKPGSAMSIDKLMMRVQSLMDRVKAIEDEERVTEPRVEGTAIKTGTATIAFNTGSSNTYADITFDEPFDGVPGIVLSQPFQNKNIITTNVTENGFRAALANGFTSSGTRVFTWIAFYGGE